MFRQHRFNQPEPRHKVAQIVAGFVRVWFCSQEAVGLVSECATGSASADASSEKRFIGALAKPVALTSQNTWAAAI